MDIKHLAAKITSVFLIASSIYQTFLSLNAIFFIYPNLEFSQQDKFTIQTGLVEKALVLYISMVAAGIYGLALILKPIEKISLINIIFGLVIFLASIFFVTQTPFTNDPLIQFIAARF